MSSKWPAEIKFKTVVLQVEDRICKFCKSSLHLYKDRIHRIYSFDGALKFLVQIPFPKY